MTNNDILQARDLRKQFGALVAVDGVSLNLSSGEILGVIGPNGCGKTTLFNLLSGALPPDAGEIVLQGRRITGLPAFKVARAGLCRTFQIAAPFSKMSVWDNLRTAAAIGHWHGYSERAYALLELVRLTRLRDELAENLSGGQQKLLELARVLMRDPRVVLLDEIGAGVNPALKEQLAEAVLRQREQGRAFIVVEHDMEFVRSLCDRVLVMAQGRPVTEGDFETIIAHPQVIESYLGAEAEAPAETLTR